MKKMLRQRYFPNIQLLVWFGHLGINVFNTIIIKYALNLSLFICHSLNFKYVRASAIFM